MKQADLLDMIDRCIALCEQEKAAGYSSEATQYQIEDVVLPDLQKLRETVLSGDIPADPGLRHLLAFCVPFKCWDWDMIYPTELYTALANLQNTYRDYNI